MRKLGTSSKIAMLISLGVFDATKLTGASFPYTLASGVAVQTSTPQAEIRVIKGEVRKIVGMRTLISGETHSLEALSRRFASNGLTTRTVNGGLEVTLPGDVLFDFDKATLRPAARPVLDQVVDAANQSGERQIQIEGHSDAIGESAYNLRLSVARATAVRDWLYRSGVDRSRISARGFGAARPVAPNVTPAGKDSPQGRQKNRRVTVTFAA